MAPETLGFRFPSDRNHSSPFPIDIWCFGETVYQMLTGEATFTSVADLFAYSAGDSQFPEHSMGRVGQLPKLSYLSGG
jgi:serine/threonine protein kinase